nr:pentapeptide repeat-containing protein [Heliobacterium chlorum]
MEGAILDNAVLNNSILQKVSLKNAKLINTQFIRANLQGVNLLNAKIKGSIFIDANLQNATLSASNIYSSDLSNVNLRQSCLEKAKLKNVSFSNSNLSESNFESAEVEKTDLSYAQLIDVNFKDANILDCTVFGIAPWGVNMEGTIQSGLVITKKLEPAITVDNIEIAPFIYALLHNKQVRHAIDTITDKVVLILGRFTPERKKILDAIRSKLKEHDYIPVIFDFEKPHNRDLLETVMTLAHLSRFIIADITEPSSVIQELQSLASSNLNIPVKPLLQEGYTPWSMFEVLLRKNWMLDVCYYEDLPQLMMSLDSKVIQPLEEKRCELSGDA